MGKSLKTLATQLKKNHGCYLVSSFDDGIVPGSIIQYNSWNDINRIGMLKDDTVINKDQLGEIEGPTPCLLTDFNRAHDLTIGSALEIIQPTTTAGSQFKRAKEAMATFGAPVTYSRSLFILEEVIENSIGFWGRPIGQALLDRKTFMVYRIIKARLSFLFRKIGNVGLNMTGGPLKDLKGAGISANWSWRNEATLESKKEIVVAVELANYVKSKQRLVPV